MMNQNMNLGSIQKQMEETHISGIQPRQPYKLGGGCQAGDHLCNLNLPSQSFYPYSSHYTYMHMNYSSDWEIFEAVKIQELEEVKARAAQMEKTMRWWSDCTANWREKWSKVRGERNKAREEARQLRIKLDSAIKEISMLKKINQNLISEKENLENGTGWKTECSCSEIYYGKKDENLLIFLEPEPVKELSKIIKIPAAEDTKKDVEANKDQSNHNKKIIPKHPSFFPDGLPSTCLEEPRKSLDTTAKTTENDLIHVSVLHLHLAEIKKILQKEREMNAFLEKEMEKMENELFLYKWKYEELRHSKLESLKQLERMQCENTSEWGKREQLEAEKNSLEEQTRKLKLQKGFGSRGAAGVASMRRNSGATPCQTQLDPSGSKSNPALAKAENFMRETVLLTPKSVKGKKRSGHQSRDSSSVHSADHGETGCPLEAHGSPWCGK